MRFKPEWDITGDYTEDFVLAAILAQPGAFIQYFWIPGEPVANERARTISNGGKTWSFTPKTTVAYRNLVFNSVYKQEPVKVEPPFSVALKFICSPGGHPKDLDNFLKSVFDAVFSDKKTMPPFPFRDDKYITDCLAFKRVAQAGEEPGVKLWLIKPQTTKIS